MLLLRTSAAMLLMVVSERSSFGSPVLFAVTYLVIPALLLGYRTRVAAGCCAGIAFALLTMWRNDFSLLVITHVMDALALLLLGPGALSIDARLYGRRVITFRGSDPL